MDADGHVTGIEAIKCEVQLVQLAKSVDALSKVKTSPMQLVHSVARRVAMARHRLADTELASRGHKRSSKLQRYLLEDREPSAASLTLIARLSNSPLDPYTSKDPVEF